ncbi:hypothetical protein Q7W57_11655 [Stenotrophomonas geniculata]|uniref:Uncharacterized protein n=1 Tax=Stenotrophomonas geniculata TaxID=86188 RepID=A0AAP5F2V4_9GAMM|nr:hypothetical protein [Stenotrophomonas geniculata]MBH1448725.1 hypothetical protein [Stenotrophomonas maltophilia]MDP4309056.1 hypothetical protein [Stenotrophomonas geniculata]MDQ7952439.1 hypothetical protein [Stenotrophomonas geniculata]
MRFWKTSGRPAALFVAATVLLMTLGLTFPGKGMINNGDFLRVHQSMPILTKGWEPLKEEYAYRNEQQVSPDSLMAGVAQLTGLASRVGSPKSMPMWTVSSVLLAVFLSGTFILVRMGLASPQLRRTITVTVASLSVFAGIYAVYFRSLYEEAMVLALAPTLAAGIIALTQEGKYRLFTLSSAAILVCKAQMILMLPVLLVTVLWMDPRGGRYRQKLATCLFLTVCGFSYQAYLAHFGEMSAVNNYNRTYNGIGWALQRSADWPAKTFEQRLHYFSENRLDMQARSSIYEPDPSLPLLGTSYWPTGAEISTERWSPATAATRAVQIQNAFDAGKPHMYVMRVASQPALAWALLRNTVATAWKSDYSLSHLRSDKTIADRGFNAVGLSGWAFQLGALLLVVIVAVRRTATSFFALICFGLIAPLFVVLGDGYYEFEKHMAPYIMLTPAFVAIQFANGGRRKPGVLRQPEAGAS